MCGRYTQTATLASLAERFKADPGALELSPAYNLAPTQEAVVVGPARRLAKFRWGLDKRINARAETLAEKFGEAFRERRCLVPADGFYEWKDKKPVRFTRADGTLFAFAGLWGRCKGQRTFTIVTTSANALVAPVHDRMPVILRPEDEARWLDSATAPLDLLAPLPAELMACRAASPRVNSVKNDGPELLDPA